MDTPDIRIDPTITARPFDRAAHCRDIAHRGGLACVLKHGIPEMRRRGALGFARYAELHHSGNRASARGALMESKPRTFRKG